MWCYRSSVIKHNPCVISYEHWVFKSLVRLNAETYIKPNHNIVCLRYTYKVKLTFFGNNVGLNPTVMYVCNFVLYFLFIVFFFCSVFHLFQIDLWLISFHFPYFRCLYSFFTNLRKLSIFTSYLQWLWLMLTNHIILIVDTND